MNISVEPVNFLNKRGLKLFGMLHIPDKPKKNVGVIILSPGIKSRVAPHRLYVKMAKRFSNMGFKVLRFDPEGLGDSEGEIEEKFAADVYGSIQIGRFKDDTIAAMDWMESEYDISRFILTGLCGGAITGLLTGARDSRVDSLLGLGIPVIMDSINVDHSKYITEGQLRGMRYKYLKKTLKPKAWLRFFTLKSNYRVIYKLATQPLRKFIIKNIKRSENKKDLLDTSFQNSNNNFNPHFPEAFFNMAINRKLFLIFSERDRLYWEFEEKFKGVYNKEISKYSPNFNIHIVNNANHIFSFSEWQNDMLNKSCTWLKDGFMQV